MGSPTADLANQAMWLYPKISGFIPSERWGHSACYSNGLVYVFGGCCGGLHLSDVLVLNLNTMSWNALATKGKGPGPRDSHSAVLYGNKMLVFGGTNGSNKLNDVYMLDLGSNEWTRPLCTGNPPCPRESHTSSLVGEDKMIVFGGSGEGIGNYLNDLHLLDLKSMAWSSLNHHLNGNAPSPRDSHVAGVVGDELLVFGGDSGDRYHGDVHKFHIKTMTWIKLVIDGSSPAARAGHAAVSIGHKIFVIGGVGDNKYYNDSWILDTETCLWSRLDVFGPSPQGRFSHTAIVAGSEIVIYGGCGEDERPVREFLIIRLRNHHPNKRNIISPSEGLENPNRIRSNIRSTRRYKNLKTMLLGNTIEEDTIELHSKRRRPTYDMKQFEPEEHSLSVSLHSSPSQSDQEQTTVRTDTLRRQFSLPLAGERSIQEKPHPSLIGAEVQGKVDGAFDSGYLMTALINGRVFRGVLFAPVPGAVVHRRGAGLHQNLTTMRVSVDSETGFSSGGRRTAQPSSIFQETVRRGSELEGMALSLGVPGNDH